MFNQPTTSQTRSAPTGSPERFAHRTRTVVTLCTQAYGMKYNMQMSEHVRMAAGMEVPLRKNLSLYHFELSEQAMDNWESYSARALDLPILAHARGTVRPARLPSQRARCDPAHLTPAEPCVTPRCARAGAPIRWGGRSTRTSCTCSPAAARCRCAPTRRC